MGVSTIFARFWLFSRPTPKLRAGFAPPEPTADLGKLFEVNDLESDPEPHEIQFRAIDERTNDPIANLRYAIEVEDGASYTGHTDANGLTRLVQTSGPRDVELSWLDDEDDEDDEGDEGDGEWC